MAERTTDITTSGGLISTAFIENIRELGTRQRGIEPKSFALPSSPAPKSPRALEETIATAWELLKERWDTVGADLPMMSISQVRTRWLLPLFQLLDFEPVYLRSDTVLDEAGKLRYPLSHRGWEGDIAPVIHTVLCSQGLDERPAKGRGVRAKSPHDVVQAFLNASTPDLWAVLTNGILLRLLRDYHHTFTKGYVEFDLESIFEARNYGDFRALYRMCHASRFVPQGEGDEAILPLEQFYKDSIATGIKVGEDLRGQVRQAIETLGNGFLDGDLIRHLQQDEALCRRYYSEILRIIYRILFLLFAEQRGMLPGRESLYAEAYSIARLRARAEGDIPREDDFTDLWEGLKVAFRMVREGVPELRVFGYDGMLFEDLQTLAEQDGYESLLAGRACRNSDLLRAIRALTLIERERVLQRISYADLGVEELGAIYESLLDFTPRVSTVSETINGQEIPANTFFLDPRGKERKTTGSYYTHPSLVNELIKSALLPVARDRLAAAGLPVIEEDAIGEATAGLLTDYAGLTKEQRTAGEAAILSLKVCDPAVGSGHFLVKANNALGAELARIRTGDEYPAEAHVQAAKRDVLAHCIYAVDLNPMAVELCKVSLWINASVEDKPLSFLDHHIKCGNSLIGTTPELMAQGIPYEAFDQKIVGNDRATTNAIRKHNRKEQAGQLPLEWPATVIETPEDLERWRRLSQLAEEKPHMARERYAEYRTGAGYQRRELEADFWTAAFFWPLPRGTEWVPTHGEFVQLCVKGPQALSEEALAQVEDLAERDRFFHWRLEFPEVFADDGAGGFDVVLGNPPWEKIKLQEREFFGDKAPNIATASTAALRRRMIEQLPKSDPELYRKYQEALRFSECLGGFLRDSGRFSLSAAGDINTYAIFTELARSLINDYGRVGMVVQSGIATDYTYRDFFADLVSSKQIASCYDFENREGLFPDMDRRNPHFCLLTMVGTGMTVDEIDLAFWCTNVSHIAEGDRRFSLTVDDFALINPNTRTVPVLRSRRDAELARKLYCASPVLVNEETGENPWGVELFTMFHMTNDSNLFRTKSQLEARQCILQANRFQQGDSTYLPLYEPRMAHQYDHRFATYEGQPETDIRKLSSRYTSLEERSDPYFTSLPRYWVPQPKVERTVESHTENYEWLICYRGVTNATNERTAIAFVLPVAALGNNVQVAFISPYTAMRASNFVANFNSVPFDYVVRLKLGSNYINHFAAKQLPVLAPDQYTPDLLAFIVPRVLELTYTAWDLQPFAQDILAEVGLETWARWFADVPVRASPPPTGQPATPPPFVWDEERRAHLRAELDALYAHLYGLSPDELAYILDTFPIVRRKDEKRWGEYRTKRLVLEAFDQLSDSRWFAVP